ncbi:ABC transporter ATP-binding protein [Acidobacteriota bacterium]
MSVEVNGIYFSYGRIQALAGVDVSLPGEAVGLLGPNGAGKSTLIRVLLGFLSPDRGEGRIFGFNIKTQQSMIRRHVGYMPEDECFIPGMDAVSFTSYMGELSGMPRQESMKRAHEVLYYVGLDESRYRLIETYSAGMRQRLKLAQAIVHDPKLLFLDEPTSGLDPHGRKEILELITDISSKKNIQVMISSHILTDIEQTCKYVVILNKGQIASQGQISDLTQVNFSLFEIKVKGDSTGFVGRLQGVGCKVDEMEEGMLKVYMPPELSSRMIFQIAAESQAQIRHFIKSQSTLEDLFAQVVGVD